MEALTTTFRHYDKDGHLAIEDGRFYWITDDPSPTLIPIPRGAAILGNLSNRDIIRFNAGVLCRERMAPHVEEKTARELAERGGVFEVRALGRVTCDLDGQTWYQVDGDLFERPLP